MQTFSELLEEYLTERDRQNSDYYDNKFIGARADGRAHMKQLAEQMDKMTQCGRAP